MVKKAVKWQWQGDDKEWVEYATRVSEKLEESFKEGSKSKVRVDSQRYVDLKAMLQCRYDQSGRKRTVKRVEEQQQTSDDGEENKRVFEGCIFFLLGDTFSSSREKLVAAIDGGGGLVAWGFHKRVTHVITDKKQIEGGGFSHIQKESLKHGIPIVSDQFILSSLSKNTLLDTSSFLLSSTSSITKKVKTNKEKEEEDEKDEKDEKSKNGGIKRKNSKQEDEDDDEKQKKASKDQKPPPKKHKSDASVDDGDDDDDDDDASLYEMVESKLKKGSEAKGKLVVKEHVFDIAVVNRKGDELNGTCEWPTLDNTITKWKGNVINNNTEVKITEFEAMEGDGVELPNKYHGKAFKRGGCVVIVGTVKDPHEVESPFEIKLL